MDPSINTILLYLDATTEHQKDLDEKGKMTGEQLLVWIVLRRRATLVLGPLPPPVLRDFQGTVS